MLRSLSEAWTKHLKKVKTKRWHCYCISVHLNSKLMKDQTRVIAALLIGAAAGAALGASLPPSPSASFSSPSLDAATSSGGPMRLSAPPAPPTITELKK